MARSLNPRMVPERDLLPPMPSLLSDLCAGRDGPASGGWQILEPPRRIAGLPAGNVALYHLRDVAYFPRSGLVLRSDGSLPDVPAAQVPARDPELRLLLRKPVQPADFDGLPRQARGAIWVSAGSRRNYGHFIFDSLTGLNALRATGLSARFTPASPRLRRWQRDLMTAAHLEDLSREMDGPAIRFDELIYLSAMDHYLQRNADMLIDLARRIRGAGMAVGSESIVYLSRRGYYGRVMLNEARLEAALKARGVRILRPHRMSVREQIGAMRSARTVIAPSGAALANMIFLAPGARLIELRPRNITEQWVTLGAANLELSHRIVMAESPLPLSETPLHIQAMQLPRRLLNRYHFCYRVDLDEVLAALDQPA